MLDDYVMEAHSEEFYQYLYDYEMHETWDEIEYRFCEEVGIEFECYED